MKQMSKSIEIKTADKADKNKALSREIRGIEHLTEFTFPEHGITIKAVDMPTAIKILEKRLKGSVYV